MVSAHLRRRFGRFAFERDRCSRAKASSRSLRRCYRQASRMSAAIQVPRIHLMDVLAMPKICFKNWDPLRGRRQ